MWARERGIVGGLIFGEVTIDNFEALFPDREVISRS